MVLTSGLCPPEIQAKPAQVARTPDGSLVLAPEQPLSKATLETLRTAGITVDAALPPGARSIQCWAEAIAPARVPVAKLPALVLLTTPDAADLVDLAAELLRLGCERQELLLGPAGGVIRVVDPPTYTIMRAVDRERGIQAFAPDPPGQDAVWTELGHKHPLVGRVKAAPGHLLLIAGERWRSVRDEGWRSLDSVLELAIPGERIDLASGTLPARRKVELRLAPGRREPASLWVIRQHGLAAIDKLLAYLPDDVVGRLTFAATGGDAPIIVIRARTSRHPPPDLSLDAEVYAPLAHMPDVYSPAGAIVEPPLRRERLRTILGIESGQVAWLAPIASNGEANRGPFRVERIADSAFAPLAEWADYVVHESAEELAPWLRAATFELAPFVSTGLEWASAPPAEPDDKDRDAPKRGRPARRRA
ncbi:MAG: hypothetical protein M3680_36415, partial [Myxococcota bacterium]|nr:hypothetical protein [Myxococcota bacterium]